MCFFNGLKLQAGPTITIQWRTGKLGFRLGQMHSGTNYLGDLIVCKLIHVLFLWNNFQDKRNENAWKTA